ncbi:hypothetical protein DL98DRAFT_535310 [Cadophora sp. DSE1049]|nr:hypothetical protein DL98DRAFT_535310 [Cadophora sp. DSE1049]
MPSRGPKMKPSLPDVNSVAAAVPCWPGLGWLARLELMRCDPMHVDGGAGLDWLTAGHGLESCIDDFGNGGLWMVGRGIVGISLEEQMSGDGTRIKITQDVEISRRFLSIVLEKSTIGVYFESPLGGQIHAVMPCISASDIAANKSFKEARIRFD